MRSIAMVVVFLMLGVAVKESTAYDKRTYESCFSLCCLDSYQAPFSCSFKCLKKGLKPAFSRYDEGSQSMERSRNCTLRCTKNICAKISSKRNPNGAKAVRCLESCAKACKMPSHVLPPQVP